MLRDVGAQFDFYFDSLLSFHLAKEMVTITKATAQ
jgi:hypothetical protein